MEPHQGNRSLADKSCISAAVGVAAHWQKLLEHSPPAVQPHYTHSRKRKVNAANLNVTVQHALYKILPTSPKICFPPSACSSPPGALNSSAESQASVLGHQQRLYVLGKVALTGRIPRLICEPLGPSCTSKTCAKSGKHRNPLADHI